MRRAGLLMVLPLLACMAGASAWAAQEDLGSANQFGVLSFTGSVKFNQVTEVAPASVSTPPTCPGAVGCNPDTGAVNIGLSFHDFLYGDAIASLAKGAAILMGPKNGVSGECVTGGGGVLLGSLSYCTGGIDRTGTNSKVTTLLPDADADAAAFSTTLAGLTDTQTLPAIALTSGEDYNITTTAGLNIISVPSIVTKGNNIITITAGASDSVAINIGSAGSPGELILGPSTQIVLSGGITPDRVVFNVLGYGYAVSIGSGSVVNGTILAPDDGINVATDRGSNPANYTKWTTINGALIAGKSISIGCLVNIYFYPLADILLVQGACLTSSSLAVLVQGNNVVSYVPKASWGGTNFNNTGISVIQIEGSGTTPTAITTANPVNSCASNPITGQTVCTSNGTDVYLLTGTSLDTTLTSGASTEAGFSGGLCETCGVTIDIPDNRAILTEGTSGGDGFQFLDLTPQTFEVPFASASGDVSEEIIYDPIRKIILNPSEDNIYEIVNTTTSTPAFYENAFPTYNGEFDSAGEDCSTGIALASDEFGEDLYLGDLTQATFTPGSPGTWGTVQNVQAFPEFALMTSGDTGLSVAQGSHIGIVTGEFGGNYTGAIQLPATSGSGTPSVLDYVVCPLPNEPNGDVYSQGFDPHTVTSYVSPNTGDAMGLTADGGPNYVAVIDLTKLLNTSIVPRQPGTHLCSTSVNLETAGVVNYVAVP